MQFNITPDAPAAFFRAFTLPLSTGNRRPRFKRLYPLTQSIIKEPLNKSGRAAMRIKIAKCEARNAVNIGNIDKFRNEAVGDF
jgi:hypothetical protein